MPKPVVDPEPELPVTPRKESAKGDATPSTFAVSQRWFAESRKDALLLAIAILSPLVSLWYVRDLSKSLKQSMWVWHLDSSGVMTYAPIALADPDSEIFREILMQAAEVYLKRNPGGLSNKELLLRYFEKGAAKSVEMEIAQSAAERARRNLFDQPEFKKQPERMDASSGRYRYRIVGFIVRSGVIDGLNEKLIGDFKIGFELEPNDAVRDKGRFPFIIKQYKTEITWRGVDGTTSHEVFAYPPEPEPKK